MNFFNVSDLVIYPSYGVCRILASENCEVGDIFISLLVLEVVKTAGKSIVKVPLNRARELGVRNLEGRDAFDECLKVLKKKRKITTKVWTKRSGDYEQKINSGQIQKMVEVIRELFNESAVKQSSSERNFYKKALDLFTEEMAIVFDISQDEAKEIVEQIMIEEKSLENPTII